MLQKVRPQTLQDIADDHGDCLESTLQGHVCSISRKLRIGTTKYRPCVGVLLEELEVARVQDHHALRGDVSGL